MNLTKFPGYKDAVESVEAHRGPRFRHLDKLERFVETTQYDDRDCAWFDDKKPLWERRPAIAYPIVASAIASNVDLVLGEGRFPKITADQSVSSSDSADEIAKQLDPLIAEIVDASRFRAACREALSQAQATGTCVAILGVRNGRPFVDITKAKWCTPELDGNGDVTTLTIQYPYLDVTEERPGEFRVRALLYRRVIDDTSDTTFRPVQIEKTPAAINWQPDPAQTYEHGFGFCPAIWHANLKGPTVVGDIDGRAIHDRALDEIEALDLSLSQRHRCALFLEPQIVEIGVAPGTNPTETGRAAHVPAHPGPPLDLTTPDGVAAAQKLERYVGGDDAGAAPRKKGPGYVWQYPSDKTKVEMLELSSGALEALSDHCHDLRIKVAESLSVVFLDPDNLKFAAALSGKALAMLKQRQLDRCDQTRDDFGDGFVVRAMRMLLRIVDKKRPALRGLPKAATALRKFVAGIESGTNALFLRWGDYFKPGTEDDKALVELAIRARDGGLITKQLAVRKVQRTFGIEDVVALLADLDAEAEEREAKELEPIEKQQPQPGTTPIPPPTP